MIIRRGKLRGGNDHTQGQAKRRVMIIRRGKLRGGNDHTQGQAERGVVTIVVANTKCGVSKRHLRTYYAESK